MIGDRQPKWQNNNIVGEIRLDRGWGGDETLSQKDGVQYYTKEVENAEKGVSCSKLVKGEDDDHDWREYSHDSGCMWGENIEVGAAHRIDDGCLAPVHQVTHQLISINSYSV